MSSRSDTQISERLSICVDLLGYAFEDGGCCRLHGVSGGELDYVEELTVAQALALRDRLERAVLERSITAAVEKAGPPIRVVYRD